MEMLAVSVVMYAVTAGLILIPSALSLASHGHPSSLPLASLGMYNKGSAERSAEGCAEKMPREVLRDVLQFPRD